DAARYRPEDAFDKVAILDVASDQVAGAGARGGGGEVERRFRGGHHDGRARAGEGGGEVKAFAAGEGEGHDGGIEPGAAAVPRDAERAGADAVEARRGEQAGGAVDPGEFAGYQEDAPAGDWADAVGLAAGGDAERATRTLFGSLVVGHRGRALHGPRLT